MSRLLQFVIANQAFEALGFNVEQALALASGDMIWVHEQLPVDWYHVAVYEWMNCGLHDSAGFWLEVYYNWCVAVPWEA